jgi:hypothetical protein
MVPRPKGEGERSLEASKFSTLGKTPRAFDATNLSRHGLLHSSNPRPGYYILRALARRRPAASFASRALGLISAMVAAALFKASLSQNLGCLHQARDESVYVI